MSRVKTLPPPRSLDLSSVDSPAALRSKLAQWAVTYPEFAWLSPIVDLTLAERVGMHLNAEPAKLDTYLPSKLESNITECVRLMERTLALRSEIFGIESQAILTALDYALAESASVEMLKLSRTQLRSSLSLLTPKPDDADDNTALALSSLTSASRKIRIDTHNSVGSSLNYGERVIFLSQLYARNIKSIYERAVAIRRGLSSAFDITLSSIPRWNTSSDTLGDLVHWTNLATELLTIRRQTEREHRCVLRVMHDQLCITSETHPTFFSYLQLENTVISTITIPIEIKREHFDAHGAIRLVSITPIALFGVYESLPIWRAPKGDIAKHSFSFSWQMQSEAHGNNVCSRFAIRMNLVPPIQRSSLADDPYDWVEEPCGYLSPGYSEGAGAISDAAFPEEGSPLQNIDPVGEWQLTIKFPLMIGSNAVFNWRDLPGPEAPKTMMTDIVLAINYVSC